MKPATRLWTCALGAVLMTACQQGGSQANGGAAAAGNASNAQTANASAPAAPAAVAPEDQTGPVALATDNALPASCQRMVREVQTCIDHLSGSQAGFREGWLRSSLASSRSTWASAYDDSYRGPLCEQDLAQLHTRTADWNCGIH